MVAGAPNVGKTWGDNLFQSRAHETSKFKGNYTYRAANASKFWGPYFEPNYIEVVLLVRSYGGMLF